MVEKIAVAGVPGIFVFLSGKEVGGGRLVLFGLDVLVTAGAAFC